MKDLSTCKYVAIDFDGTIAKEGVFPFVTELVPHANRVINRIYDSGRTVTIWTCREQEEVAIAKIFLVKHGIRYHHINENTPELKELFGNDCRKIGADVYIDDKSHTTDGVDWLQIEEQFFGGENNE